jgi:hypothetical protein
MIDQCGIEPDILHCRLPVFEVPQHPRVRGPQSPDELHAAQDRLVQIEKLASLGQLAAGGLPQRLRTPKT